MNPTAATYDEIPYPTIPFPESHPDRLAAVAKLFGLDAPPGANARVLELGCSMGGNLLAIAQIHPGARCVGVDASATQIAEGWKTINALGLRNVELKHLDILDIDDSLGEFDYIISHGVFSWVPAKVQDKMLEVCRRLLAPNGVAYISFNTYPGWHIRGIVRDMMVYRGKQFPDSGVRLGQAKSLVEFVANAAHSSDTPYRRMLQDEFRQLGRMSDYYLHHEFLEAHNLPLYFHEFAEKLAVNGLQYLGDSELSTMISTNFSADIARTLHDLGAHDILQMEQYMDFVRCRYFRKSLICRNGVVLNRAIDAGIVGKLLLLSDAKPEADEPALDPAVRVTYESRSGGRLTCRSPLTKIALKRLKQSWPMPTTFADLCRETREEAAAAGHAFDEAAAVGTLSGDLLTAMGAGVVEWRVWPVAYTTKIPARPAAGSLARFQASQGARAANLRGEFFTLDEIHRQIIRLLDGSRDLPELLGALMSKLNAGEFVLHAEDSKVPITDDAQRRDLLAAALPKVLENLARQAFLLARPVA